MSLGLIGKKVGMTQIFDEEGVTVPVTVIQVGDNYVVQKLSKEVNGYTAVQVGGFVVKEAKVNKPQLGQFKKNSMPPLEPLAEFRIDDSLKLNVGERLPVTDILKEGMLVDVRGRSIGKSTQGTVKRFNAGRGPMAHGSKFHRSMGSIGQHTDPGRVFKGLHMPGRMGNENVCVRHLKVVRFDPEKQILLIRGAVPGAEGGILTITPSKTKWN
jgi:large subunit ribosomal protein L3